jgi:hypothetical protein
MWCNSRRVGKVVERDGGGPAVADKAASSSREAPCKKKRANITSDMMARKERDW